MISGYTHNGMLQEARSLFIACREKNVRTYTILLSGYAKHGFLDEARIIFESMPERNVVSWNALVSGYVQNGELKRARELFDEMPERNISSWNSIITGYCRCGMMREAWDMFHKMDERNNVTWMVMISGYVEIHEYHEAWGVFLLMLRSGVKPDQALLVVGVSAIIGFNHLYLVCSLRTIAIKTGCEKDVVVGTTILNAYTRIGDLDNAFKFFQMMPERNEYSWATMISALSQNDRLDDAAALYDTDSVKGMAARSTMISAYARKGKIYEARKIFDEIVNPSVVTWNAMLTGYALNGKLEEAKEMFLRMPVKNSTSWAAIISCCVQNGRHREALNFFAELHKTGGIPSQSGFASALLACASIGDLEVGRQIHSLTIKTRCQHCPFVGNVLISMYAKRNNMEDVSQPFKTVRVGDDISWNPLIAGFSENGMLDDALKSFQKMPKQDTVSWTTIISAYVQAEQGENGLKMFLDMLATGIKPNDITITSLVSACGSLGATKLGEQFHALILKYGFDSCLCVCNSLISMYFKCGSLDGLYVFKEMPERDIVTWNAVLTGCAHSGLGTEAIKFFDQMEAAGVSPNEISFLGLLGACSHAGLVEKGWAYFNSMSRDYGITPMVYHYTCVVDILGRSGQLYEAEHLINNMPVRPDYVIWDALLAACRIHQNMKLSLRIADKLLQLGNLTSGTYTLLSNIYASQGMWNKVGEVRELLKDRGIKKEPAISWIHIKNRLHSFLSGDKTHENIEEIHSALGEYYKHFRSTGYVVDTNHVLHDVEEEEKQTELLYHSEKLAVAYGVLHAPNGAPIQIMKNIRTCGDCHSFMKFMSTVTDRKIIIRDGNRFHHIQNGSCSCGDYW